LATSIYGDDGDGAGGGARNDALTIAVVKLSAAQLTSRFNWYGRHFAGSTAHANCAEHRPTATSLQAETEHRHLASRKIGEDRTRSSGDMLTDRQTEDRQTDMVITILRSRVGGDTIRYDTVNVCSKADMSQLNLPQGNNN